MILITHILFAVISVIYSAFTAILPSKIKLRITYLLGLGTIISGSLITIISHLHIVKACIEGVIYLGFIAATSIIARKRFTLRIEE